MMKKEWWQRPLRVIQYNLQVLDTPKMDPVKLIRDAADASANAVLMNIGGIYSWYPTKVPYHHRNEYLPEGRDLLRELIEESHRRGIRFIGRFDFNLAVDSIYLQKPHWFAQTRDKQPMYVGEKRMGNWPLLLSTCRLGGYCNEEVAIPVLREVVTDYDIDAIFLNDGPGMRCSCPVCQEEYKKVYGVEMPENRDDWDPQWGSYCMEKNVGNFYRAIKENRSEVQLILGYIPHTMTMPHSSKIFLYRDDLKIRLKTADLLSTESMDKISLGVRDIPSAILPTLNVKAGKYAGGTPPFGIIHSCPGMDWRHTGIPPAEHLPWASQIPAAGGNIWHSLTGFQETITDRRIFPIITKVNQMSQKCDPYMEGAKSCSDVLLLWDGGAHAAAWADVLIQNHIQFDLQHDFHPDADEMKKYALAICPDDLIKNERVMKAVMQYVSGGGKVLIESSSRQLCTQYADLFGFEKVYGESGDLSCCYMRTEGDPRILNADLDTDLIPLSGTICYGAPCADSTKHFTLVPPFSPLSSVGAPPERASLPVSHTDIPLCLQRFYGQGEVVFLPFSFSRLITEFHMQDHYVLARNLLHLLRADSFRFESQMPPGVIVNLYQNRNYFLIHLVNEIGTRPLLGNVACYDLSMKLSLPPLASVKNVKSILGEEKTEFLQEGNKVSITLHKLEIWDMLAVEYTVG